MRDRKNFPINPSLLYTSPLHLPSLQLLPYNSLITYMHCPSATHRSCFQDSTGMVISSSSLSPPFYFPCPIQNLTSKKAMSSISTIYVSIHSPTINRHIRPSPTNIHSRLRGRPSLSSSSSSSSLAEFGLYYPFACIVTANHMEEYLHILKTEISKQHRALRT